jgi:hypothetical protein
MFDNYYCFRCKQGFKWEQMTATKSGTLFCPDCWQKINPENEPERNCPVDGAVMKKVFMAEVLVIDVCPTCQGTWFDKAELDFLKQRARDRDADLAATLALLAVF